MKISFREGITKKELENTFKNPNFDQYIADRTSFCDELYFLLYNTQQIKPNTFFQFQNPFNKVGFNIPIYKIQNFWFFYFDSNYLWEFNSDKIRFDLIKKNIANLNYLDYRKPHEIKFYDWSTDLKKIFNDDKLLDYEYCKRSINSLCEEIINCDYYLKFKLLELKNEKLFGQFMRDVIGIDNRALSKDYGMNYYSLKYLFETAVYKINTFYPEKILQYINFWKIVFDLHTWKYNLDIDLSFRPFYKQKIEPLIIDLEKSYNKEEIILNKIKELDQKFELINKSSQQKGIESTISISNQSTGLDELKNKYITKITPYESIEINKTNIQRNAINNGIELNWNELQNIFYGIVDQIKGFRPNDEKGMMEVIENNLKNFNSASQLFFKNHLMKAFEHDITYYQAFILLVHFFNNELTFPIDLQNYINYSDYLYQTAVAEIRKEENNKLRKTENVKSKVEFILKTIAQSCIEIIGNPEHFKILAKHYVNQENKEKENHRTRTINEKLKDKTGYYIDNQHITGQSQSRKSEGIADYAIMDSEKNKIIVAEAINIKGLNSNKISKDLIVHLNKLANNYNQTKLDNLLFLVYYEGNTINFQTSFENYKRHFSTSKGLNYQCNQMEDVTDLFLENQNVVKIGKSIHSYSKEKKSTIFYTYHFYIDFSDK